jgi:hypothetical protein
MPNPATNHSGHLSAHAQRVTPENGAPPSVDPPTITSFSPSHGSVDDDVVITGTNFDGLTSVKFGTIAASTTARTSTSVTATVPAGASTGKITVTTVAGSVVSATNFTVDVTSTTGSAPNYSAYVTRKSIGIGGQNNTDYLDQIPSAKITRVDVQGNLVNYTTLNAGITAAATSIGVAFVNTGFPSLPFVAKIDSEYVTVTAVSGSGTTRTLTVTRAARGSTAAAHSNGVGVTSWNWTATDSKVKNALDLDIEVLALIAYNCLDYSGWTDQMAVPTKNGTAAHADAKGHTFDQWATWYSQNFVYEFFQRYSRFGNANPTSGVLSGLIGTTTATGFKYDVKFAEIWNESNNIQFWAPNNDTNYIAYGNTAPVKDYAEFMAKCYDAVKDINANIYVGNAGFAARAIGYARNGEGPTEYMQDLLAKWDVMGYTQHTNGWADIPLDFICHHPYGPNGRGGASQVSSTALSINYDNPSNKFAVITVQIHNLVNAAGFGSLKIWGTESDDNWDPICVTNYGFRGDPPSTSYVQHGGGSTSSSGLAIDQFPSYDRSMMSANEEYTQVRGQFRIWTGADAWAARTDNKTPTPGYIPRWDVLGKDTPLATDPLPLGPRFHFAGGKDFGANMPYPEPYKYGDHFGLWRKDGTKKIAATGKDPHDALAEFPKLP